ncbi:MAG: 23S rRNA (guanosine(2251)-2'-O)-methyltransferase RlmB [Proteobacteria bacterium]|nr:23S rRNA (guanosine(2251)-2'-O)-methyltransferase RlmB [Pseudomonadota bacterium]
MGGEKQRVYGVHSVRTLVEKRPESIQEALILKGSRTGSLPALRQALDALNVPVEEVERERLDRMSGGGRHQGVLVRTAGIGEMGIAEFEELAIERSRSFCCLVLDGVQDPRNLGACLRSADAAGVDAVVVPRRRAASLTAAALKAASGAAAAVPLVRVSNLAGTLRWLRKVGVWIVGADGAASQTIYQTGFRLPLALVVGGEGRGLRRLTLELCDETLSIPMRGVVESLNVSVAVGVLLFEVQRQLRGHADSGASRGAPGRQTPGQQG